MYGIRIALRCRTRPAARWFDIRRPLYGERLFAPNGLEQRPVGALRKPVHYARRIGETHLVRIHRRTLRLFGSRILQPVSGSAQVPEVAPIEVLLRLIVLQHRIVAGIRVALRLAVPEAMADRSGIGHRSLIQDRDRPGEIGLRHMAEAAGLVSIHRKILVKQHKLAQHLHLFHPGARLGRQCAPFCQRLLLDLVHFPFNPLDLLFQTTGD